MFLISIFLPVAREKLYVQIVKGYSFQIQIKTHNSEDSSNNSKIEFEKRSKIDPVIYMMNFIIMLFKIQLTKSN